MLSVKIAYNAKTKKPIGDLLDAEGSPMFEFYNEDNPKETKQAWKYKNVAGARALPFIGCFEGNKLIKAFYGEDKSANSDKFFEWLESYVEERAYNGFISITKIEGEDDFVEIGETLSGITECFFEGLSLYIDREEGFYQTSPITKIDWNSHRFFTLHSTYSFKTNEKEINSQEHKQED